MATQNGGEAYINVRGVVEFTNNTVDWNTASSGGGVYTGSDLPTELVGSDNEFTSNNAYAIVIERFEQWTDGGGNTFTGNVPGDIQQ